MGEPKMKKWEVNAEVEVTMWASFTVEATSKREAIRVGKERAEEMAHLEELEMDDIIAVNVEVEKEE